MLEAVIIVAAIIIDQLTKMWASGALGAEAVSIIPGIIDFRYVRNTGAAFSMFSGGTIILTVLTGIFIVAMIYILYRYKKKTTRLFNIFLSVIVGGAVGNFIDRVILGYVVDYIEFSFVDFAVFNFADICVTIGAILMGVYLIFCKNGRNILKGMDSDAGKKKEQSDK